MTTATATPIAPAQTLIPTGTWKVDPSHSTVGFSVKHMGIATVRGSFARFEGTLEVGNDLSDARAYGTVEAASVDTREEGRDEHLRSADFFAADEYPELSFSSTEIRPAGDDVFLITGDLTIRGVTREITLDAELTGSDVDPYGNTRVGLEVRGRLDRSDYGMRFNQALGSGNVLVADRVKLELDISAVRQG